MAEFNQYPGNDNVSIFAIHNLTKAAIFPTLSMFVIGGMLFTVRVKF